MADSVSQRWLQRYPPPYMLYNVSLPPFHQEAESLSPTLESRWACDLAVTDQVYRNGGAQLLRQSQRPYSLSLFSGMLEFGALSAHVRSLHAVRKPKPHREAALDSPINSPS